jgi:hypothetical protein
VYLNLKVRLSNYNIKIIEGANIMIKVRKLDENEKPFLLDGDYNDEELEAYWSMCLDVRIPKSELQVMIDMNGYCKETLSNAFYLKTGYFMDEISEDRLSRYKDHKPLAETIYVNPVSYKVNDIVDWITFYVESGKIEKAIDEVKKIEVEYMADWERRKNDEPRWDVLSKKYSYDFKFLLEGINKITNLPNEFKKSANEIINIFNEKSKFKAPLICI